MQIPVRPSSVQKYAVTIPQGIQPGGRFQANLGGQLVWLNCPRNLGPGKQMLVDANSSQAGDRNVKSWPPPIAVPDSLEEKDIPDYFLCPITGCLMRQPAMTPDGVTYDHDAIAEWLQNKHHQDWTEPEVHAFLDRRMAAAFHRVQSFVEVAQGTTTARTACFAMAVDAVDAMMRLNVP